MSGLAALALLAAVPVVIQAPPVAPPVDAARLAAARQMVDVMNPAAERDQRQAAMLDQLMGAMITGMLQGQPGFPQALAQHPQLQPIMAAFINRIRRQVLDDLRQHMPEMTDAQAIAYARLYTVGELETLKTFFATPVGRRFMADQAAVFKQPEIAEWQRAFAQRNQQRTVSDTETLKHEIEAAIASEQKAPTHGS